MNFERNKYYKRLWTKRMSIMYSPGGYLLIESLRASFWITVPRVYLRRIWLQLTRHHLTPSWRSKGWTGSTWYHIGPFTLHWRGYPIHTQYELTEDGFSHTRDVEMK